MVIESFLTNLKQELQTISNGTIVEQSMVRISDFFRFIMKSFLAHRIFLKNNENRF
jgi:hypothetical protein